MLAKQLKMKQRKKKVFKLLGTLGASLLWNLLTGKGAIAKSQGHKQLEILATLGNMSGRGTIRADEGTIRAGRIFNAASSFNKFWNTKVWRKQT